MYWLVGSDSGVFVSLYCTQPNGAGSRVSDCRPLFRRRCTLVLDLVYLDCVQQEVHWVVPVGPLNCFQQELNFSVSKSTPDYGR